MKLFVTLFYFYGGVMEVEVVWNFRWDKMRLIFKSTLASINDLWVSWCLLEHVVSWPCRSCGRNLFISPLNQGHFVILLHCYARLIVHPVMDICILIKFNYKCQIYKSIQKHTAGQTVEPSLLSGCFLSPALELVVDISEKLGSKPWMWK